MFSDFVLIIYSQDYLVWNVGFKGAVCGQKELLGAGDLGQAWTSKVVFSCKFSISYIMINWWCDLSFFLGLHISETHPTWPPSGKQLGAGTWIPRAEQSQFGHVFEDDLVRGGPLDGSHQSMWRCECWTSSCFPYLVGTRLFENWSMQSMVSKQRSTKHKSTQFLIIAFL